MISLLFLCAAVWLGLILDEEFAVSRGDFPVRIASALLLGCCVGGWIAYLLAWCFGFQTGTVAAATTLLLACDVLAATKRGRNLAWFRSLLTLDRAFWRAYLVFPLLITASFLFGFWIDREGNILYRGNFTDLAFHMGTVSAFLEQDVFPPLNPQSAAAKLSYHFMTDFLSAVLCRGGFSLFYSLKVPMVLYAFALGTVVCHFFDTVLRRRTAAVCAAILFFFGHIGVFNLLFGLAGHPAGNAPLTLHSWSSIEDHLTFPYFNFLNVLIDFFQPQLAFLFGFPLAVLILLALFRAFAEGDPPERLGWFLLGLVALLPLFHMHSFLVLAPLVALFLLFAWRPRATPGGPPERGRRRGLVRAGALLLAATAVALQFAFILSQKKAPGFSGFDVASHLGPLPEIPDFLHLQRVWFWLRVAGPPLLLGLCGFLLPPTFRVGWRDAGRRAHLALLAGFALGAAFFVLINFYRFTPSWGDSNKFFLYWDLLLCAYAGRLLARLWESAPAARTAACLLLLLGAVLPSSVEWCLRFRRGPTTLFTASDRVTAAWIRLNTPRDAIFLTANSYTHYVTALAGRRVVNGAYTQETGFADGALEETVARAYREANPSLITTVKPTYVVVGPDEKSKYHVSRANMARRNTLVFDYISRGLRYSVYQTRDVSPEELAEERRQDEAKGFVWLSQLDPAYVQQFGTLQYDESFDLTPLTLDGKAYGAGLGTHAPSEIRYELDGRYTTFLSDIGIDDRQRGGPASVIFRVLADGKVLFASPVMKAGTPHEAVKVDVTGVKTLVLIVEDAGDGNHDDHADWGEARLVLPR